MGVKDDGTKYWLFGVLTTEKRPDPQWASLSTVNWARSLALEIVEEHGATPAEQFESCKALFDSQPKKSASVATPAIFEPLFSSLTCSLTVTSAILPQNARFLDWSLHHLIVSWYYAHYTAARAMLTAAGQTPADTHSATIAAYGGNIAERMPHPLNMHARYAENDDFDGHLPTHPEARRADQKLNGTFSGTRPQAQGNLLAYLVRTAKREADPVKERLLRDLQKHDPGLKNFQTRLARGARDQKLKNIVANFMSCAYRYRGKANYRDAIYLAYGSKPLGGRDELAAALATSAQFAYLCALAFVRRRVNASDAKSFVDDVARNLRGVGTATPEELFWKEIAL
jgi:hypothetical protein